MTDIELKAFRTFVEDMVFIGENRGTQEAKEREKATMDGPWYGMGPDNRRLAVRLNELMARIPFP